MRYVFLSLNRLWRLSDNAITFARFAITREKPKAAESTASWSWAMCNGGFVGEAGAPRWRGKRAPLFFPSPTFELGDHFCPTTAIAIVQVRRSFNPCRCAATLRRGVRLRFAVFATDSRRTEMRPPAECDRS